MTLNVRLGPHGRALSADRDLAYCAHHMVGRAIAGLDPGKQEPWIARFLKEKNVSNQHLCEGAVAIAKYMNIAVFEPLYEQPITALERCGFFKLPEAVQIAICAKIGQVLLSSFFVAARDVTYDPSHPPVDGHVMAKAADETIAAIRQHQM